MYVCMYISMYVVVPGDMYSNWRLYPAASDPGVQQPQLQYFTPWMGAGPEAFAFPFPPPPVCVCLCVCVCICLCVWVCVCVYAYIYIYIYIYNMYKGVKGSQFKSGGGSSQGSGGLNGGK